MDVTAPLAAAAVLARGPRLVGALHAAELPQKDNLCGCFWGAIALRAAGIAVAGGQPVTQDSVAAAAGTTLPVGDPATFGPPGESPRRDYALELPRAFDPRSAGTSAPALARAIETLAEGRLAVVPVAGPWHAGSVTALVEEAATAASEVLLVANVRSGLLWGSRPPASLLLDHLAGGAVEAPPADWDVGHFVNLAGLVRGAGGDLVVVRDSYRSLGWEGHHLQPPQALARALERGDGSEGGVLCIAPAAMEEALRERLGAAGYALRHWQNGTPDPGGAQQPR